MKIILMYDLIMDDAAKVKEYTKFHRWIIKRGYIMVQYSVYAKTISAVTKYSNEYEAIKKIIPTRGNVRLLIVTERQYFDMKMLRGTQGISEVINNERRYVKIDEDIWE